MRTLARLLEVHFQEFGPHGLGLLLDRRAHVEELYDRAHVLRRLNGCKSCYASTHDEHLCWRHLTYRAPTA